MSKPYEYEVRCPSCNVSFPTGTKKCIHCGGRTGPSHGPGAQMRAGFTNEAFDPSQPEQGIQADEDLLRPLPVDGEPEEEPSPRSGLLRSAITLVWILLAVGFSVVRACSDGGQ